MVEPNLPEWGFDLVEALALAVDARDRTSLDHVRRVQVYAVALSRALGLSEDDIQSVRLAALLHDIGKLAVPEHILSKPGPLTAEEFHKIRSHPRVGADILRTVRFPTTVASLILGHHERWDGKGYPSGLKGTAIPIGARILSVVDCFDALMSMRPYHDAMSAESAIELLKEERGHGLDPEAVDTFLRILPSLPSIPSVSETSDPADRLASTSVFDEIASAHREIYALYEIAQVMGTSLGVSETMSQLAAKVGTLIPFSCCALYLYDEAVESLRCHFASGTDAEVMQQVVVRHGRGMTGWVAQNRRSLTNWRPQTDLEAAGLSITTTLESAVVTPLLYNDRCVGTLALYHTQPTFYTDNHRRLLERVSVQAAAVINHLVVFEQAREDALTDPLTGLPNTRSMFVHLARELDRAARLNGEVSLFVMDLENLREINRSYGHQVGNGVLCNIARTLRAGIRPYDICVRYAAGEFIVVLSGCGGEEAERKREELQHSIETLHLEPKPGKPIRLRASVGSAVFPRDGASCEALLAAADRRLSLSRVPTPKTALPAGPMIRPVKGSPRIQKPA